MIRVVVLLALLTACSPLDLVKPMLSGGSGPSLEVDTTVGDKEESVVGQVGSSTEIASESITGGINTTNVQDIPPWVLLVLVLGWMLPSPTVLYKEIKSWRNK
tara:strand:- start:13 stop:321 length:309 start_codon:yes stop_codon:yes gene_type:complete